MKQVRPTQQGKPLSVRDVALARGWSLTWIYSLLWSGRLPGAQKVGKQWQIPPASLERYSQKD